MLADYQPPARLVDLLTSLGSLQRRHNLLFRMSFLGHFSVLLVLTFEDLQPNIILEFSLDRFLGFASQLGQPKMARLGISNVERAFSRPQ